jgi:hypothetical protein
MASRWQDARKKRWPILLAERLSCLSSPCACAPLLRAQAGLVLTLLFVPNIMALDLREGDRRFDALMANNPGAYNGAAVAPQNLSFFERCASTQALVPLSGMLHHSKKFPRPS